MTERTIEFVLEVEGGAAAGQQLDSVRQKLAATAPAAGSASTAVNNYSAQLRNVAQSARQVTSPSAMNAVTSYAQRWGQVGSSLGQVGAVVGRLSPELGALGGILGQIGGATSSLSGAMGPLGAAVAGVTTAVGLGAAAWSLYAERQQAAARVANETAAAFERSTLEGLRSQLITERAELERLRTGGSDAEFIEQGRVVRGMESQLSDLERPIREREEQQREQERREQNRITAAAQYAEHERENARILAEQNAILEEQAALRGGGGGRGGGASPFGENETRARLERESAFARDLEEQAVDDHRRDLQERERAEIEMYESIKAAARETWEEEKAASRERMERAIEERDAQIEALEKQKLAAREAGEEIRDHAMGVLQPAVSGLVDALSAVLAGTKSADEAFMGMLSSFLEMISQQAALEAAKEFASAIASFASQDYPGGAMHIAAGVAWTGVAIAAGAGAVATAPAAQSAPASPERGATNSGSGDRTVVVNVNGPMMNAGGRAELGRDIRSLVEEGDRYYGSAA